MRILIIDDEELDLFINKKLLSLEYEAEGFSSVQDAVRWAEHNEFDIALIDYYLGQDLFAHHALKRLLDVKGNTFDAFVLSNYVDKNQSQELLNSGFKDIIYKPLTVELFKSTLNLV